MDWVLEKMRLGRVEVVNPFNPNQKYTISLKPEDVKCWMWWSKNFEHWIRTYQSHKTLFKNYKAHCFQFTINSPSELEKGVKISLDERLNQLEWLVNEFGPSAMNYRYDPIVIYKKQGSDEIKANLDKFEYIIGRVAKCGIKEVIFSFAQLYSKVEQRMLKRGYLPIHLTFERKKEILSNLLEICNKFGLSLKACCQPDLLSIKGVEQSHCIDAYKIEKLIEETLSNAKDTGQRKECGCHKSKDIGGYKGMFLCRHNCDYCYASPTYK